MVTYRMKFRLFVIFQPIILALYWLEERKVCQSSALEYPEQTLKSFGITMALLRGLTGSSTHPLETPDDALSMCCKVHAFFIIIIALLVPGAVIWYLEQQTWREFSRVDPRKLTWERGPDEHQIYLIQRKLRRITTDRAERAVFDGRMVAISYVFAATLWQLLDTPAASFLVKSTLK